MVIYFNRGDLVLFGQYLLSQGRRAAFEATQSDTSGELEDRIKEVFHSDIENWKVFQENKSFHKENCKIKNLSHPDDGKCTCYRGDTHWRPGQSDKANK